MPRSRNHLIIAARRRRAADGHDLAARPAPRRSARYARSCRARPSARRPNGVTLSSWNRSAHARRADCRRDSTSLQPVIGAAQGMPQALAWNIGTIGSTTARARQIEDSRARCSASRGAWSSDARTARPWDCRSCRWCSRARTDRARRLRPSDNRRPRPRASSSNSVVEADVMLDRRPSAASSARPSARTPVVEQHAVLGMVGDIFELIVEQARIDGVEHAAHADRAVPADVRWRSWFIARVATRSPGLTPSRSSAWAMRRASWATRASWCG